MIDKLLRTAKCSEIKKYHSGDIIFSVGEKPLYYFYIIKGTTKLVSKDGSSKELKQGDQGLAEFSVFVNEPYPVTAIAITNCTILEVPIVDFLSLMRKQPKIKLFLLRSISDSLYYKFLMAEIHFKQNASDKIRLLLDYLKRKHTDLNPYSFPVTLTRQNIADLTGLRVETVIRNVKKLEQQKVLKIINRKIFY